MTSTADLVVPTSLPAHRPARRGHLGGRAGFWVIALAFLAAMAFSTVPTPLYALYAARDGFATWVVTVIFAAYALGVLLSLFLIGHISDWAGRRRMILVAIAIELLAGVLFLVWNDVAGLIVARFITGIGVGTLTASATAHLSELAPHATRRAGIVSTVVNTGGLALGPLVAGVLAQFAPSPLVVPYAVFLLVLALAVVAVSLVPETVERREERPAYRPQRLAVPGADRARFFAAGVAAFAGFAVLGLYSALAPTVLAVSMHETSRLLAGVASFLSFAASAVIQVVAIRVPARVQLVLGIVLAVAGLAFLSVSALLALLPLFLLAAVVGGAGVGLLFRAAIGVAAALAAPDRRGEVLAAVFLFAYAGLAVPVLLIGAALMLAPLVPILVVFAVVVAALVIVAGRRMLRH
ncbi:MFS transporter [Lysinimonas soli]|uniref:MFS transporter n=1 Tax=Lysinimonas soli TaxID=1074233 RepID=A0ABW0NL91_9MICO